MQQPELVLHHPFSFQLPILLNVQSRQRPATRNKNRHSSALARHQHPTEKMSNSMKEKHLITSGLSRILPPRQLIFSRSQKKESQLDCQLFRPRRSSSGQAFHIKMEFPLFECDVLLHSADNNTERWPLEE